MNPSIQSKQYKLVPFLATLYLSIGLILPLISCKLIFTPFGSISAAAFISPIWLLIGDTIAETYGFKMALKFFWAEVITECLFNFICYWLINLQSPTFWQGQNDYHLIVSCLVKEHIWATITMIIAWRLNTYLLLKWKVLLRGKYFWMRSVGSSVIGMTLFTFMMSPTWILYGPATNFSEAIHLCIGMCIVRTIFTAIYAMPGSIIIRILKIVEHIDEREYQIEFNPFKKPEPTIQ